MSTPFPIKTRGHRPLVGKEPRVTFSTMRVDKITDAQYEAWRGEMKVKPGVLMDRLVAFGKLHGFPGPFFPVTKKAGSPSTAHPAKQMLTSRKVRASASSVNTKL